MSTKIYFQLPHARKELFEEPRKRWEEVIARFPNAIQDIDEAAKCFALSRYAACVFHCVQIIEHGLLPLGAFLSVNDPLSGWTSVAGALKKIIDKKYDQRSEFEKKHSPSIEQMQGTVEALKNANIKVGVALLETTPLDVILPEVNSFLCFFNNEL